MNAALDGKTALVIGAGRSLGRALSLALAGAGAAVAAQDLSPVGLDVTADAVRAAGGSIRTYCGENGKGLPAGVLMDEVLGDFRRIDVFFHCAWAHPKAGLLELDEWDWQRTFETNVTSPYLMLRLVGRHMQDRHAGAAGIFTVDAAQPPVFAASQTARLALARAAAVEFSAYNISVFAICLGDHQSISGEATVPPGDETLELARVVRLALQLADCPTLPRQIVYRPNADPNPSSPE